MYGFQSGFKVILVFMSLIILLAGKLYTLLTYCLIKMQYMYITHTCTKCGLECICCKINKLRVSTQYIRKYLTRYM